MLKKLSAAFTGGFVAALLSTAVLWYLASHGLLTRIGVTLHPSLSIDSLLIAGGIGGGWGLLFLLPLLKARIALRGTILALPPTLYVLCYQMPRRGHGLFALQYGDWAPLVILLVWILWGVVGAFWHKSAS